MLCETFAEVLHLPEVQADDSFFALGGDSITAIQVVSRARTRGVTLTPGRSSTTAPRRPRRAPPRARGPGHPRGNNTPHRGGR
ncbi:phosphopantetheine-binding protein [Streptomyces endophytica]|uniref:phosphopantetheine-binding protein n=1 Tax=Streptomyces endophytica TaxID=2991496 RepID=UPI003C6F4E69